MSRTQVPCLANRPAPARCRPRHGRLSTYEEVVDAYIRDHRAGAKAERQFFKDHESLELAIENAALCRRSDGKRHPHHNRRKVESLSEAESVLQDCAAELECCATFHELFLLIGRSILPITDIGNLVVYDVATWIGAYLDLSPELVYLHAGAAKGAAALGFRKKETINPTDLPKAFRRLKAFEIEDCLCIYKDELKRLSQSPFVW